MKQSCHANRKSSIKGELHGTGVFRTAVSIRVLNSREQRSPGSIGWTARTLIRNNSGEYNGSCAAYLPNQKASHGS